MVKLQIIQLRLNINSHKNVQFFYANGTIYICFELELYLHLHTIICNTYTPIYAGIFPLGILFAQADV